MKGEIKMAKVVDITEKLSFDENPRLKIRDVEVEVNADAETMLKIMGEFTNKNEMQASLGAFDLMFSEKEKKKILKQKPAAKDLMEIIQCAMNLIMGEEEQGEQ